VQLTSLALASRLDDLLDHLEASLRPRGLYLRTEKGILEEEGLQATDRLLRGEEPSEPILIEDGDARYWVDLRTGHKTGFYLDQRENRAYVRGFAQGARAADVFSYSGSFSVSLLLGGAASVVAVDSSEPALELARRNVEASGLAGREVSYARSDAFRWLEEQAVAGERYDLIVLDPPRFARTSRGVPQALKAYERLNLLALGCLAPGGVLVTCSCSGRVRRDDFLSVLGSVEATSGRRIQMMSVRGQAADHPVSPTCPETEYLKCVIARVE
jgi:23S rRNA (cytosine1962-C5)-methyltransferase